MINLLHHAPRHWQHARDLISVLIARDLKILYKRSSLGFGWALALPLLQLIIYTFVFRKVLTLSIENYPSFVFIGVLVFGWFQSSLSESSGLITGSKALVTQPGFPLTLLPHVKVGVRLFHFLIALPFLFILLGFQGIRPSLCWISIPLLIGVQYMVIAGLSYPLASFNVIFRDTQHMVGVLIQLTMFLTPIFYSIEQIPAAVRRWFYINPMVGLVECWRAVLLDSSWPDPWVMTCLFGFGVVALIVGRRIFERQSHRFIEELS